MTTNTLTPITQPVKATRFWGGASAGSAAEPQQIVLDAETYAEVDREHGLLTIHRGQQTGQDSDWGGQVIGSLALSHAMKIFQAMLDAQPATDEDAYYDWLAQREEDRKDALADSQSAHFGHD